MIQLDSGKILRNLFLVRTWRLMMKEIINAGKVTLGIEFGSTRIKAVLIDDNYTPIASGAHDWENRLEDGFWTYSLEDVWNGVQDCYQDLQKNVQEKYGVALKKVSAIGISAMMHGYMPFDKDGNLLTPFRTWRNSTTGQAAEALSQLFDYNIPQRWSIAHLEQAILNKEEHVGEVEFLTTLAGYIHWKLTGEKVLGVGDASGMFPIDAKSGDYCQDMVAKFDELNAKNNYAWKLGEILPCVLSAGEVAGTLSDAGAKLLDPTGALESGCPLCPPEGDAGTGMVATNSVTVRTGNVSAGTSTFAMIVLEKELSKRYMEIDMVTTPAGDLVAMVHANNCTSDWDAWVNIFGEFAKEFGLEVKKGELYDKLYFKALEGDADCGGLLSYGYFAGEDIMGVSEGRPLFVREQKSNFTLANFTRTHLFSTCGALKVGMNLLLDAEDVKIDKMLGHGGLFKTKEVGQRIMAAAIGAPVYVMETAGEGGAWGIALLAAYTAKDNKEALDAFLSNQVFGGEEGIKIDPDASDVAGFEQYIERYVKGIDIEKAAIKCLK